MNWERAKWAFKNMLKSELELQLVEFEERQAAEDDLEHAKFQEGLRETGARQRQFQAQMAFLGDEGQAQEVRNTIWETQMDKLVDHIDSQKQQAEKAKQDAERNAYFEGLKSEREKENALFPSNSELHR